MRTTARTVLGLKGKRLRLGPTMQCRRPWLLRESPLSAGAEFLHNQTRFGHVCFAARHQHTVAHVRL